MQIDLVAEGLKFMVLGMSTVFLFLILMVYVLKLQSFIVNKYFVKEKQQQIKQSGEVINPSIVAAISIAIKQFQKRG